jgi:hypothetical protein
MKKSLFFISLMGLMLLLSGCDDSFMMDDSKTFTPIMYEAKQPETLGTEATTLMIKGVEDLVFDEIEKTDWKIITRYHLEYRGDHPLELTDDDDDYICYDVNGDALFSIPTNYGEIVVTFDKIKVTYNYLGNEVELMPDGGLKLYVNVEEEKREDDPFFLQIGNIVFQLCVGSFPVKIHKLPFCVYANDEVIDNWIKEVEKEIEKEQKETNN